jgi:hypothetical protein
MIVVLCPAGGAKSTTLMWFGPIGDTPAGLST